MKRHGKIVNKNNKSKKKVTYKRGLKRKSSKNVGKKKRSKISYKRKRITRKKVKRGGAAAAPDDLNDLDQRTLQLSSKCGIDPNQFYFLARHRCADAKHDGMVIENDFRYSYKSILMTMGYNSQQSDAIIDEQKVNIQKLSEWNILTDLNPNLKDIMQGKGVVRKGIIDIPLFGNKYEYIIYHVNDGNLEPPPDHDDRRDLITQLREQNPPAVMQFDNSSLYKYMKSKDKTPLNILKQFAYLNDPGSSVSDHDIRNGNNIVLNYPYDSFEFKNFLESYSSPITYPNCVFDITWDDKKGENCQITFQHPTKDDVKKIYRASSSTKNKPNSISSLKKAFSEIGKLITLCAKKKYKSATISPDVIDETNYLLTGLNAFCKYSGDCGFRWELSYLSNEINKGYICTIDRMLIAFCFMTKMNGMIYKVPFSSLNPLAPKKYILFKLIPDQPTMESPSMESFSVESLPDYILRKNNEIISNNNKITSFLGDDLNTFNESQYETLVRSDDIFKLFYNFLEIENSVNNYLSEPMLILIEKLGQGQNQDQQQQGQIQDQQQQQLEFIKDYDRITDFIPLYGEIVEKVKDIEENELTSYPEKVQQLAILLNYDIHLCLFSEIYTDKNNEQKWFIMKKIFDGMTKSNGTHENTAAAETVPEDVNEHATANLSTTGDERMVINTGGASFTPAPTPIVPNRQNTNTKKIKTNTKSLVVPPQIQNKDMLEFYIGSLHLIYNFVDHFITSHPFDLFLMGLFFKFENTQVKSEIIHYVLLQMKTLYGNSEEISFEVNNFQILINDVNETIQQDSKDTEVIRLVDNIYNYLSIAVRYHLI